MFSPKKLPMSVRSLRNWAWEIGKRSISIQAIQIEKSFRIISLYLCIISCTSSSTGSVLQPFLVPLPYLWPTILVTVLDAFLSPLASFDLSIYDLLSEGYPFNYWFVVLWHFLLVLLQHLGSRLACVAMRVCVIQNIMPIGTINVSPGHCKIY